MKKRLPVADSYDDIPASIPRPIPKGKLCEKMCKRCPFKPDGSGYAQDHPDLPNIVAAAEMGLAFYCHETVIFDPRTVMDDAGESPAFSPQSHFELCRGAHEHRMKTWAERTRAYLKKKPG